MVKTVPTAILAQVAKQVKSIYVERRLPHLYFGSLMYTASLLVAETHLTS